MKSKITKTKFKKQSVLSYTKVFIGGGLIILILTILFISTFIDSNLKIAGESTSLTPTPTIEIITNTPTPSETRTPTPTLMPKTQYNYVAPTVDPDPLVNCELASQCGTVKLKRSVCNNAGCCQIGNKYVVYYSQSECTHDQLLYDSNNKPSTNNAPPPTTDSQNGTYGICSNIASGNLQACNANCTKQADTSRAQCKDFKDYNMYITCLGNVTTAGNSCFNGCWSVYDANIKTCK